MPLIHLEDREVFVIQAALKACVQTFESGSPFRIEAEEIISHLNGDSPQYVECSRCRRQVALTKHRTLKDHRTRPGGERCSGSGLSATKNGEGSPS